MSRWFRHYAGMMRDEKLVGVAVRSKQPIERVVWVWGAILESAAEIDDGGRFEFDAAEAAYFLRADENDVGAIVLGLADSGRIAESSVVKWGDRQYQSDKSASRQAAYRERKRKQGSDGDSQQSDGVVTSPDRDVTPPDTDTEIDTGTSNEVPNKGPARKTGTALPDNFEPDATCHAVADELRYTTEESRQAFDNFRDYWRAVPGAKGRKLDWQATFRNWLRNNHNRRAPRSGQNQQLPSRADKFAEFDALIDARFRTGEDGEKRSQAFDVELSRQ